MKRKKLTQEILAKWHSAMTEEGMKYAKTDPQYTEYIKRLQDNIRITKKMAECLVDLIEEAIKKELEPDITSGMGTTLWQGRKCYVTPNKLTDKEAQRIINFMSLEGKESNSFLGDEINVAEQWPDKEEE